MAIDTWTGDEHSRFYGDEIFSAVSEKNKNYENFSSLLRKRFDEADENLDDGSIDLLHVDGRHFYADVKTDFESWTPNLSPPSVVLFNDTEVLDRGFGVHRHWAEVAPARPSFNFKHEHGLDVLLWGSQVPEGHKLFRDLFGEPHGRQAIADYFAMRGELCADLVSRDYDPAQLTTEEHKSNMYHGYNETQNRILRSSTNDLEATLEDLQREWRGSVSMIKSYNYGPRG